MLIPHDSWNSTRPSTCRQCGKPLLFGEAAVVDDDAPWLALHLGCLQDLVPERIVALYDEIEALTEGQRIVRANDLRKRLGKLRDELTRVEQLLDGTRSEIPPFVRPGHRRRPMRRG